MATLKNVYGVTHTGGTTDHNRLYNRDLENQHPISAINGLTEELQELDDKITEKVLEESSARKSADSILQVNINSEATTRLNKDTELQNNINDLAIVVAGKIDKTYVDSKVLSEETARINADNTLQNNINTKVSQTEYNAKISSIETSLSNKANISYVDEKLALKANQSELNDTKTRVSTLEETVGNSTKGLVKDLADEIARATDKEGELQTSITNEETKRQDEDTKLSERIQNLESRGRFLSTWNAVIGKPETEPITSLPYLLKAGDYFIVSVIADSGAQNKRPEAKLSEGKYYYDGTASVTVEAQKLSKNDYYTFDGTKYILINNTVKDITFANIAGDAESNINLKGKLDNKISLLGNEAGSGEPYHFTYYYDIQPKEDRYDISIDTITLDNSKTLKKYNYSIPAATQTTAGLMSSTDKIALENKLDKPNEPVLGQGINIPYYFEVNYDADKAIVKDYTIDLLNKDKGPKTFSLNINAASIDKAGLMTASDKIKLDDTYIKSEIETKLDTKQDKLTAGNNITINENSIISSKVPIVKVSSLTGSLTDEQVLKIQEDGALFQYSTSTQYPPIINRFYDFKKVIESLTSGSAGSHTLKLNYIDLDSSGNVEWECNIDLNTKTYKITQNTIHDNTKLNTSNPTGTGIFKMNTDKFIVSAEGNEVLAGNLQAAGLTDGTTTKTMTEVLEGSGPSEYIKSASTSGNTLTLTKQDDTIVTFTNTTYGEASQTTAGLMSSSDKSKLDQLTTASGIGSATKGIYIDTNGVPQTMTYELNKTVPSNAVFTDTTYSAGTGISIDSDNKINNTQNQVTGATDGTNWTSLTIGAVTKNIPTSSSGTKWYKHTLTRTRSEVTETITLFSTLSTQLTWSSGCFLLGTGSLWVPVEYHYDDSSVPFEDTQNIIGFTGSNSVSGLTLASITTISGINLTEVTLTADYTDTVTSI